jgi:hypothetical protein
MNTKQGAAADGSSKDCNVSLRLSTKHKVSLGADSMLVKGTLLTICWRSLLSSPTGCSRHVRSSSMCDARPPLPPYTSTLQLRQQHAWSEIHAKTHAPTGANRGGKRNRHTQPPAYATHPHSTVNRQGGHANRTRANHSPQTSRPQDNSLPT